MRGNRIVERYLGHQVLNLGYIIVPQVLSTHLLQVSVTVLENTDGVAFKKYRYLPGPTGSLVKFLLLFMRGKRKSNYPDCDRQDSGRDYDRVGVPMGNAFFNN